MSLVSDDFAAAGLQATVVGVLNSAMQVHRGAARSKYVTCATCYSA